MSNLLLVVLLAAGLVGSQSTTSTVSASPATAAFSYQLGASTLPAAQKISVKPSSGTPSFTTAIADPMALWLTVGPDSGTLPVNLSLRVNPTGLGVGQYSTAVSVTVTGIATPISVPVTLNITSPPSTLTLSATTLTFSAPPSPVSPQTVQLSTDGAPISFLATAGAPWLSVTPGVGVVLPGWQEALTITADPSTLVPAPKPYTAKITVAVSGGSTAAKAQTITVNFTVNSATPTITSIWPRTLPVNAGAQTITIRGTNFYAATVASIQGVTTPLATTLLSASALLAVVPATQSTAAGTLKIVVSNPMPGGSSAPVQLPVANIPSITAVTNVASYASASISPGELVTIFGTNIGPGTPASMSVTNGSVDRSLGGVTLTIDSQPAPLLYVSQNQVTAQVPYEVTLGTGKQVSLTNGTNPAATSTVTVASVVPGVFTADGSGTGQAVALNYGASTQTYTLNTASNPAHIGDTILLYLTGEGDYNPTLSPRTGLIVPTLMNPLPQLNPLPTVTIGGAEADVAYAGPLAGSILGLTQINCVVPAGAATGTAVAVVVTIGSTKAQSGVTLSVHP